MNLVSDGLAKKVGEIIEEVCRNDWQDHVENDGEDVYIDEDAVIRNALDLLINDLAEELGDHKTVRSFLIDARIAVKEIARDAIEYDRNQLAYHGMSQKDFV